MVRRICGPCRDFAFRPARDLAARNAGISGTAGCANPARRTGTRTARRTGGLADQAVLARPLGHAEDRRAAENFYDLLLPKFAPERGLLEENTRELAQMEKDPTDWYLARSIGQVIHSNPDLQTRALLDRFPKTFATPMDEMLVAARHQMASDA